MIYRKICQGYFIFEPYFIFIIKKKHHFAATDFQSTLTDVASVIVKVDRKV